MTTLSRIFAGAAAGMLMFSCATSLDKSPVDRVLRLEGSYTCSTYSRESAKRETVAQADASRVRCAQDSWALFGNEIRFTRTLFQSADCRVPLGKIQYSAPFTRLPDRIAITGGACQSVRTSVAWVGESSGKCLYHRQVLNRPYPLQMGCHAYIPELCKGDRVRVELSAPAAELSDDHREAVSQLSYVDPGSKATQVCKRYAAD